MNVMNLAIEPTVYAISVNHLIDLLKVDQKLTVLDVRTKEERESIHIQNSAWIPLGELPQRLSELNPDCPIIIYCHTDNRSKQATRFLLDAQFKSVKYLVGGIVAWANFSN